jgi:hypothetical protein
MKRWFSWTRWVNPVYYGLESLIVNEFDGLTFECAPPNLAPWGPGYEGGPAGCAIQGARPGSTQVSGKTYMHVALWFFKKVSQKRPSSRLTLLSTTGATSQSSQHSGSRPPSWA